eukprot:5037841-Pleurochrysis_carterae.AAC.2
MRAPSRRRGAPLVAWLLGQRRLHERGLPARGHRAGLHRGHVGRRLARRLPHLHPQGRQCTRLHAPFARFRQPSLYWTYSLKALGLTRLPAARLQAVINTFTIINGRGQTEEPMEIVQAEPVPPSPPMPPPALPPSPPSACVPTTVEIKTPPYWAYEMRCPPSPFVCLCH